MAIYKPVTLSCPNLGDQPSSNLSEKEKARKKSKKVTAVEKTLDRAMENIAKYQMKMTESFQWWEEQQ